MGIDFQEQRYRNNEMQLSLVADNRSATAVFATVVREVCRGDGGTEEAAFGDDADIA